ARLMDGVDEKDGKLSILRLGEKVRQRARRRTLKDQCGWFEPLYEFSQPFRPLRFQSRRNYRYEPARLIIHGLEQLGERNGCVAHAAGEAPLIIVPGQDAYKTIVNNLGLRQVEVRRVRVVI